MCTANQNKSSLTFCASDGKSNKSALKVPFSMLISYLKQCFVSANLQYNEKQNNCASNWLQLCMTVMVEWIMQHFRHSLQPRRNVRKRPRWATILLWCSYRHLWRDGRKWFAHVVSLMVCKRSCSLMHLHRAAEPENLAWEAQKAF